jgi:ribosomal protein L11 methylase PrmA
VSRISLEGMVDSLERTVRGMKLQGQKTEWGDYYHNTNYSDGSLAEKARVVEEFLKIVKPARVLDLGANDGTFSRVATGLGAFVVSADIDPIAVDSNYRRMKAHDETRLLPLLVDLTNPSADLGWANRERSSFGERAQADAALALALIHHLSISGNVPLVMVAEYFASLTPNLIIEFVPKSDSQVKRLLATREDIFPEYTEIGFEKAFGKHFTVVRKRKVKGTDRTIYLLERK